MTIVAEVLKEHVYEITHGGSGGRALCRCGWDGDVQDGESLNEVHARHVAEMIEQALAKPVDEVSFMEQLQPGEETDSAVCQTCQWTASGPWSQQAGRAHEAAEPGHEVATFMQPAQEAPSAEVEADCTLCAIVQAEGHLRCDRHQEARDERALASAAQEAPLRAAVERHADRLAAALDLVLHDAHPVYSSTAGWRSGIGGQAITTGCSIIDPPLDGDWTQADLPSGPLRDYLRDHEGFDLAATKAELLAEWRAVLDQTSEVR